jgi:hypothetical protein
MLDQKHVRGLDDAMALDLDPAQGRAAAGLYYSVRAGWIDGIPAFS